MQSLFCEICKISKKILFLTEHLRWLLLHHCKLHLYRLRVLLTIPLDCNNIPCLFELNFIFFLLAQFFSSLIPSFLFFTPSKRTQNSFTTTREILDVFFILIFISIVIYSSLFTFNWLYLFTLACLYLCSLYTVIWTW